MKIKINSICLNTIIGNGQPSGGDIPAFIGLPYKNNPSNVENYTESYEYDALGNILKLIHQAGSGNWTRGYHYDTNVNNHLLKSSLPGNNINDPNTYTANYTHDAHGNLTSMPHLQSMIWDYNDMLREVDLGGGGTAFYIYSGGERVRKVIENGALVKDRLYMDGINEIYREFIGGGKDFERETLHIMDESKQLAIVETKTYENGSAISIPTPVIRYQYDNHLGSACLELDVSANIISYEEYHPFGTSAYRLGSSVAEISLKRYRYNGKERDDETGLYYYGARYYATCLGRFISVDPLANESPDLNPYHYVRNNPVGLVDPSGMQEVNSTDNEPKGEVINVHKTKMEEAEVNMLGKKAVLDNLEKNAPEREDYEKRRDYRQANKEFRNSDEYNLAQNEYRIAKSTFLNEQRLYNMVENALNEYAYYHQEGYNELINYVDPDGNPINVYIKINENLEVYTDSDGFDYGHMGNLIVVIYPDPETGEFTGSFTEEYGYNTIIIELSIVSGGSTIAHEKGHFDSYYFENPKDIEFIKTIGVENLPIGRHGKVFGIIDPSGDRAVKEERRYLNSMKNIRRQSGTFNKNIHIRDK